jgi:hypothetical protein
MSIAELTITEPTVTELTIIETIEIHPPAPEQQEAPEPEQPEAPRKHYLCRHIFVDGHQCGARALRNQHFCYYHHAFRTPMLIHQRRRQPRSGFDLTRLDGLDNHAAIQLSLSEVLGRIANDSIDPKRAWLLLYGLQIAGHNLRRARPNAEASVPETIVEDSHYGHMAEPEPGRTVPPNFYDKFRAELDKNPKADPGKLTEQLMDQFADQRPIADLPYQKTSSNLCKTNL